MIARRAVINLDDDRPSWALPDWAATRIAAAFPSGWDVVDVRGGVSGSGDGEGVSEAAIDAIAGAEVYFGYGFPRTLFNAGTRPHDFLHWVHSGSAGVASALYPEFIERDITFTNSAGIHAPPVAETALAMILHFARGIDFATRAQKRVEWHKQPYEERIGAVREIAGSTLGIYGFGGIGRELACRASALGMHVIGTRRSDQPAPTGVEIIRGDNAFDTLLERSDYVVIAAPSTKETRGRFDSAALRRMKPDAVLINVSRGDILDEAALITALESGHLRGAALDVFAAEPLPADSRLWSLDNVLITPHVSATTTEYWRRQIDLITENIGRYLAGRPLRNVVDKAAGY
ncbi:MAG: D-2-hydroxyacid dehydrogenase [Longimicrobiales bacterium]